MAQGADTTASDIPVGGWVDRHAPAAWRPYIRLARYDRPIGTWLLLFPCWWAIALATPGWPNLWLVVLFGIGAMVMRGAGCTYNDICDRDFDAQVARTRNRPLPAGEVTVRQAAVFLVAQLVVGLAILLSFNRFAIAVGAASLILVFTYPLMKRVTFWPQVFLGLAFNWGALLGWAAVRGDLALPAYLLYAGGILWTLGYDTIYAHQDRTDDVFAGVKSSARALGISKPWLYGFYAGAAVFFTMAGAAASLSYVFYVGMALGAAHLAWQIWVVDLNNPKDCLRIFRSNRVFGWTLFLAVIAGQIVR
jgi:4-hydroxybenzoate polyprenyltransferase